MTLLRSMSPQLGVRLSGARGPSCSARLPAIRAFSIWGPMTDPIGSESLHHPLGRRRFMAALTGGLLATPLAAEAQQAAKAYRVGFLSPGPAPVITAP